MTLRIIILILYSCFGNYYIKYVAFPANRAKEVLKHLMTIYFVII